MTTKLIDESEKMRDGVPELSSGIKEQLKDLVSRNKFEKAAKILRQQIREEQTDAKARTNLLKLLGGVYLKDWSLRHPLERKDQLLQRSFESFRKSLATHPNERTLDVTDKGLSFASSPEVLVDLALVYERFGSFESALKVYAVVIENFPKWPRLADAVLRSAAMLVQLQFDAYQVPIRTHRSLRLLAQALHYLNNLIGRLPRQFALGESDLYLLIGRVNEICSVLAKRHKQTASDAYTRAFKLRHTKNARSYKTVAARPSETSLSTSSVLDSEETSELSDDAEEKSSSSCFQNVGFVAPVGVVGTEATKRRDEKTAHSTAPTTNRPARKNKRLECLTLRPRPPKHPPTSPYTWSIWLRNPHTWFKFARRLVEAQLFTFAVDAYVRFVSLATLRGRRVTPQEYVEIADAAHATPRPELAAFALKQACKLNSMYFDAVHRLRSWFPAVYADSKVLNAQDRATSMIQAMFRGSAGRSTVARLLMNATQIDAMSSRDEDHAVDRAFDSSTSSASETEEEMTKEDDYDTFDVHEMLGLTPSRRNRKTRWELSLAKRPTTDGDPTWVYALGRGDGVSTGHLGRGVVSFATLERYDDVMRMNVLLPIFFDVGVSHTPRVSCACGTRASFSSETLRVVSEGRTSKAAATAIVSACRGWMCRQQYRPPHIVRAMIETEKVEAVRRLRLERCRRRLWNLERGRGSVADTDGLLAVPTTLPLLETHVRSMNSRVATVPPCDRMSVADLIGMIRLSESHSLVSDGAPLTADDGETLATIFADTSVQLRALALSRGQLGNRGVAAIADALKTRRDDDPMLIEVLSISDCNVGHRGVVAIVNAIREGATPNLRRLHLDGCRSRDRCATALARMMRSGAAAAIESLGLAYCNTQDVGAMRIARSLACVPALLRLDIRGNEIGLEGAESIASALNATDCALETLLVSDNCFGDRGVVVLARALSRGSCSLRHVDLGRNYVGAAGCSAIARALGNGSEYLRILQLSGNVRIGNKGGAHLLSLLEDSDAGRVACGVALRVVDVDDCNAGSIAPQIRLLLSRRVDKV
eukprot:g392.t1